MKAIFAKLKRRLDRSLLQKISPEKLRDLSEKRLMRAFRRATLHSSAYQILLAEKKVLTQSICSAQDFMAHCPILEKSSTFRRFPLRQLIAADVRIDQLGSVLTSSGHGSSGFALGLSTRNQMKSTPNMIDLGLELAFDIDTYRTLLINCLPMGVTFQSNTVCVANVSVREDMACAIVQQIGAQFDQIIVCGDPLFLKKLCDYSQANKINWADFRVSVIVGEETFTESFRNYLASVLHIASDAIEGGFIGSSMGVAELGLNLFNETRETIALRRACNQDAEFLKRLFGDNCHFCALPTFLVFNPLRVFVEIDSVDEYGVGDLLVSVLDDTTPIPLMRYKTGDRAKLIPADQLESMWKNSGIALPLPRLPIIALQGRTKDVLPNNGHVDEYKHALYQQAQIAECLSGAFRLSVQSNGILWEIQLRQGAENESERVGSALQQHVAELNNPTEILLYNYDNFPYGKTIDYERKFNYVQV